MSCSVPPGIANGYTVGSQAVYGTGAKVQYRCNAAYSMTGSSSLLCIIPPTTPGGGTANPVWQGDYPSCTLEFLQSAWFWLLVGIVSLLTLALLSCITWLCIRYCCRARRRVRDANDVESDQTTTCSRLCCGCCFYCMKAPEDTKDGCCDYYGCCGYAGCCACCCWCCRCCREMVEPEKTVRTRRKQKHRPVFTMKRQKSTRSKNRKKKMAMLKLSSHRQLVKSTTLPTTQMVRSMIRDDPAMFRKIAKQLPVWLPHTKPVRNINTSTK